MPIATAGRMDLVKEYYFSAKLKEIAELNAQGHQVINLGIGSPDLPPSPATILALQSSAALPQNHAYQSYVGVPALREAIAQWYKNFFNVNLDYKTEVLPLLGSKEGIMHIAMTFLQAGDEVLLPNPGYPTYRSASLLAGATLRDYNLLETNNWLPDLDALEQTDLTKVKIMWVNYPHMPTGAGATVTFYEKLVAFAKRNQILIVNDNPYAFILNEEYISILAIEGAKEVCLELNSLSKAQNMAGWRVGMLSGAAHYLADVLKFKSNMDSGMFLPVQHAAIAALQEPETWYQGLNKIYKERQKKVFEIMDLLGCTYDSQQKGMFVWAKVNENWEDGFEITDAILNKAKVFITPGGIFGSNGNGFIRASLCADVAVFEQAIERIKTHFL